MGLNIAITQQVKDQHFLSFCKEHHISLLEIPQIKFAPVDFILPDPSTYAIIFFSSKRSVRSFFSQAIPFPQHQYACIGKTTAEELRKHVSEVAFIGDKSGQPEQVAKEFKAFVGTKRVLFPQSQRSNRSMQHQLDDNQVINLITYHTLEAPKRINQQLDCLIFTSPSNLHAFLTVNTISPKTTIISWGETTTVHLKKENLHPKFTLQESSFKELTSVLKNLL